MTFRAQGLRAWLLQRLSAAYLALFTILAVGWLLFGEPVDHAAWRQLLGTPWISVLTVLFFMALFFHAWVGIRDVLMDYVPHLKLRLFLLIAVAVLLLTLAIWTAFTLVSVYRP